MRVLDIVGLRGVGKEEVDPEGICVGLAVTSIYVASCLRNLSQS